MMKMLNNHDANFLTFHRIKSTRKNDGQFKGRVASRSLPVTTIRPANKRCKILRIFG